MTCNCPATRERYGKAFPHKPGGVPGCHSDATGQARDGIVRCDQLRMCRACDTAKTALDCADGQNFSAPLPPIPAAQLEPIIRPENLKDTRVFQGMDE